MPPFGGKNGCIFPSDRYVLNESSVAQRSLCTLKKVPQLDRQVPQENPKTVLIPHLPNTLLIYSLVCCMNLSCQIGRCEVWANKTVFCYNQELSEVNSEKVYRPDPLRINWPLWSAGFGDLVLSNGLTPSS